MHCPNPACAAMNPRPTLTLADRQGIEIDYCPHCRGVWLDRGELDKLIERAAAELAPPAAAPAPASPPPAAWPSHDGHRHHDSHKHQDKYYKSHGDHYYGKRKKSLLSELFDFD